MKGLMLIYWMTHLTSVSVLISYFYFIFHPLKYDTTFPFHLSFTLSNMILHFHFISLSRSCNDTTLPFHLSFTLFNMIPHFHSISLSPSYNDTNTSISSLFPHLPWYHVSISSLFPSSDDTKSPFHLSFPLPMIPHLHFTSLSTSSIWHHISISSLSLPFCMDVCMHACMYVCIYACLYVCMHVYTYLDSQAIGVESCNEQSITFYFSDQNIRDVLPTLRYGALTHVKQYYWQACDWN